MWRRSVKGIQSRHPDEAFVMTELHGLGISDEPGYQCWKAGVTGKTIRIFLGDGEPTGILLAENSNWTSKVLVAPRSQRGQLSKREEVRRTGVYLFVGPDPDDRSRALAYIGEDGNVLKRLLRHNKNEAKDFWERTVCLMPSCCETNSSR